jgi:hypothetical protein
MSDALKVTLSVWGNAVPTTSSLLGNEPEKLKSEIEPPVRMSMTDSPSGVAETPVECTNAAIVQSGLYHNVGAKET